MVLNSQILILTTLLMLTGCSTGEVIGDVDQSLSGIKRAVKAAMPVGIRSVSENGREYFSEFFIVKGKKYFPAGKSNESWQAHVLILGDRRPYDIEVIVTQIARNSEQGISVLGQDKRLGRRLARDIRRLLSARKTDLNLIDDFRAF